MAALDLLGSLGVWWSGAWPSDRGELSALLSELRSAGYSGVWCSGGFGTELSPVFGHLLAADDRMVVASGIHSVWSSTPEATAAGVEQLRSAHGDRFLLGLGVSHAPFVEPSGQTYERPLRRMTRYLDRLDGLGVGAGRRVLAALGPRMLRLAAERSAGAHPYLVPVEHTAEARAVLGPDPLLAPEVAAVVETDPGAARRVGRQYLSLYLDLPNYTNNLLRLGYTEEDLSAGGSDRLVDALVGRGEAGAVARRLRDHLDAGATHVCLQLLGSDGRFPLEDYRRVAEALSA